VAIAVMNWVWQHSRTKNGARLVLLAIADCCNSDDGTGAWPTIPELMAKTNLSERAVQLGLKEAESAGELKIERGAMGNNRHRFAVIMSPADSAGLEAQNLRPAKSAPPQNLHPEPSVTIKRTKTLPLRGRVRAPARIHAHAAPSQPHRKPPSAAPESQKTSPPR
jgi:hypothetical protein